MWRLAGKAAVITGASKGIEAAIAKAPPMLVIRGLNNGMSDSLRESIILSQTGTL